eukprot:gb/GECG01011897.1/.p1 GENE.gb/GECG01011897.1/~~gb/GECG01011897.1/.p1  ORF type:complete len:238 (+),score=37.65 gb/GECG01011897.1/:1-714(+)
MNNHGKGDEDDVSMSVGNEQETATSWTISGEIAAANYLASSLNSDTQSFEEYNIDDATAAAIANAVAQDTVEDNDSAPSQSPDSCELGETVGKRKSTAPSEYHMEFSSTDHAHGIEKSTKFNKVVHGENPLTKKMRDDRQTSAASGVVGIGENADDAKTASTHVAMLKLRSGGAFNCKAFGRGSKLKEKRDRDRARVHDFRTDTAQARKRLASDEAIEVGEENRDANAPGGLLNPWR